MSDTGVAGLTLGGGYGWVRRKYGLSVDALVEAQVVCADGQVRTASADSNPDLFWAIRGGGGNFGVVTSFTFALQPLGPVVGFSATFYPVEEIADVLRGWRDYVAQAPDEVTSVVVTITFPANPEMPEAVHDRAVAIVGGVYVGDAEEGLREMPPLRELGTPLFDMSGPTPFTAVQSGFDALFPRNTLRAYWKSQYLDELPDAAIDVIADRARNRPAPLTLVNVFHMGGAIAAADPEATAFAERSAPFMVSIDGMWTDPADDADTDRLGALGVGGCRAVRQRRRLPELHRPGRRGAQRRCRHRVRSQPRTPGQGQGDLRPGQLLPPQQQHPTRLKEAPCSVPTPSAGSSPAPSISSPRPSCPREEDAPAGWVRFHMLRGLADENEVVTFGFFDGTLEELERSQDDCRLREPRATRSIRSSTP